MDAPGPTPFGAVAATTSTSSISPGRYVEAAAAGEDAVQSAVSHALAANVEHLTLTGAAAINGTGNVLANALAGNDAANALAGGDGNDLVWGSGGNDTLAGGNGVDLLQGGTGDDLLSDASGNGLLDGGVGNDTRVAAPRASSSPAAPERTR